MGEKSILSVWWKYPYSVKLKKVVYRKNLSEICSQALLYIKLNLYFDQIYTKNVFEVELCAQEVISKKFEDKS